ncbi:MAG TPA: DMT family transporter [Burkholderiales bacterium]|nr:DMT family transporter [Burkholderiales bacterium]
MLRLVALGAIWGGAFLFLRVAAPVLGPVVTADARLLVAAAGLALWLRLTGFRPQWRRFGSHYTLVGLMNSGIPFLLYGYAALALTAGQMAVLNATSTMWGAIFAALLLGERLSAGRGAGIVLGLAGVALIAQPKGESVPLVAVAAALAASGFYGLAAVYLRRWARGAPGKGMALGTQVTSGLLLLPFAALAPPPAAPSGLVVAAVLALGLLCGAVAYVLYFRLIADIGASGALTVTYLVPLFGMLWGALFLGEATTAAMLGGAALVIAGTVLVLRN